VNADMLIMAHYVLVLLHSPVWLCTFLQCFNTNRTLWHGSCNFKNVL